MELARATGRISRLFIAEPCRALNIFSWRVKWIMSYFDTHLILCTDAFVRDQALEVVPTNLDSG